MVPMTSGPADGAVKWDALPPWLAPSANAAQVSTER